MRTGPESHSEDKFNIIEVLQYRWSRNGSDMLLAVVLFLFLLPLALYPFSIAGDYPNHFVAFSIAFKQLLNGNPHSYYAVDWHLFPHLAMAGLALPIRFGMSVPLAFHCFLLVSAAMPILGSWTLHRQIHKKTSWTLLLSLSTFYNICLFQGFLDFNFSLGLAFLLFAFLLKHTHKPTTLGGIALALGTAVLFLSHFLGFLIFGLLLFCQRIFQSTMVTGFRNKLILFLSPLIWLSPSVILMAFWLGGGPEKLPHEQFNFGLPDLNLLSRAFFGPFYFGHIWPVIFLIPLFVVALPFAIRTGLIKVSREQLISVGGLLLATILLAQRVAGVTLDYRLGLATFLFTAAVAKLGDTSRPLNRTIAFTAALLSICGLSLQWSLSWQSLRGTNQEVLAIRETLKSIPPQSRLIAGSNFDSRAFFHTGAFVALDRDGFFPSMFQVVQPIRARKEFAAINMPGAEMWDRRLISGAEKPPSEAKDGSWFNLNGQDGWPLRFDYLIWFSTTEAPMQNFSFLEKIDSGDHFHLYRIDHQKALDSSST